MADNNNASQENNLRDTLLDTLSFKRHRVQYSLFYAASGATFIMFVILCSLSGWSVSIGQKVNELVADGHETLQDLQEILPQGREALRIIRAMCRHENFTPVWGDICG